MLRLRWGYSALFIWLGPVIALVHLGSLLTSRVPDPREVIAYGTAVILMPIICWILCPWIVVPLHERFQPWLSQELLTLGSTEGMIGDIKLVLEPETLTEITMTC